MHRARVEEQISEGHGEKQQTGDGGNGGGSGESGAEKHEVQDEAPLAAVGPEEVAIFIDDEELRGDARGEPPFPFGHDGLGGADDSDGGVVARFQFGQEAGAAGRIGIVGDARNFPVEAGRDAGEAGYQIDFDAGSINLKQPGDEGIE